jgi:hypothetical protein
MTQTSRLRRHPRLADLCCGLCSCETLQARAQSKSPFVWNHEAPFCDATGNLAAHLPSISQRKSLIRQRHYDLGVAEMRRELLHGVFFAVDEKRTLCTGLLLPSQQFGCVGMG